jgi:hypothetical protein
MDDLLETLEQGTSLVCSLTEGQISIQAFLRAYGNFYHYNALDGHERPIEQLEGMSNQESILGLHERVQAIAYQVYESDVPIPAYETAGHILPNDARARIQAVARELDAPCLLQQIREARARRGRSKES